MDTSFFAVYDGHSGARVAEACREGMHVVLVEEVGMRRRVRSDVRWKVAMAASFAKVDNEVTSYFAQAKANIDTESPFLIVGSTAVVAIPGAPPHNRHQLWQLACHPLPR
ncbi:protein phosphatase 2C 51-like [Phragmites australis]|uniref:protein phosphatase 2C 51-like n=1 Tax=Phragmites australis TaxID=29695 RepID=UPI002D782BE3|nr:protein phosphatase 2C 51-like [Phragmites australis]